MVIIPPQARVVQQTAYTGRRGEKGKDFISSVDAKGFVHFRTTRTLKPGEGLTVAVAWPKGFVTEPTKAQKAARVLQDNKHTLVGVVGFLLVLAYFLFAWNRVGRDPEAGTIVPLFEPPQGFSPAAVNYLMEMGFHDKAFAAAVINMAVKGTLKIEEDDDEFTLVRTSDDTTSPAPGEKALVRKLFRYHSSIVLKQENHKSIGAAKDAFRGKLAAELEKVYFLTNKLYLNPGAVLTILTVMVIAGFSSDGASVVFMSVWLSGWTLGVYGLVKVAVAQWKLVLSGGMGSLGMAIFLSLFAVPFVIGEFFGLFMLAEATSVLTALILLATVCLLPLFYGLLMAPTMKGRRVLDRIEGFKMYLSVAEKERLEFPHPPEETPELFEK